MLPSFAKKTALIERAPYKDERGTSVRDWASESIVQATVSGCSFQPSSSETVWADVSQAVTIQARLYVPPNTDVQPDDRVTVDGKRYAIQGAPETWESPTGAVSHIVLNLVDWRL